MVFGAISDMIISKFINHSFSFNTSQTLSENTSQTYVEIHFIGSISFKSNQTKVHHEQLSCATCNQDHGHAQRSKTFWSFLKTLNFS
jgi:hypothetical protein